MKYLRILIIPVAGILLNSCLSNSGTNPTISQFTQDTTAISSYLKKNNIAASEFPAGVWFIVDSAAEGIRPTFKDSIKLKYSTTLLANNSIVDQSTAPKHFVLDSLLAAIQFGLTEFQMGSKGRIFLPSAYTDGNNNWIFQFQLTDVKDYQLKIDNAGIDAYLSANSINAISDASGLRYTVDALTTGSKVNLQDEVQINYTTKNLSDGSVVDQGNGATFLLSNIILGLRIGLQKMPEGSTFTFYLPSRLAYGQAGNGTLIKPSANLVLNVRLLKVIHH